MTLFGKKEEDEVSSLKWKTVNQKVSMITSGVYIYVERKHYFSRMCSSNKLIFFSAQFPFAMTAEEILAQDYSMIKDPMGELKREREDKFV